MLSSFRFYFRVYLLKCYLFLNIYFMLIHLIQIENRLMCHMLYTKEIGLNTVKTS